MTRRAPGPRIAPLDEPDLARQRRASLLPTTDSLSRDLARSRAISGDLGERLAGSAQCELIAPRAVALHPAQVGSKVVAEA